MAIDPERPIEKALRAYARKRGEEAGVGGELRPAVRRRLREAVARQYDSRSRGPSYFGFTWLSWPRLAWGLAGLAVLAVITVGGWHANRRRATIGILAQNQPPAMEPLSEAPKSRVFAEREATPVPGPAPVASPAPVPAPSRVKSSIAARSVNQPGSANDGVSLSAPGAEDHATFARRYGVAGGAAPNLQPAPPMPAISAGRAAAPSAPVKDQLLADRVSELRSDPQDISSDRLAAAVPSAGATRALKGATMAKEVRAERRLNTDSVSFRFARVAGQAKDDASAFDPTSGAVLLTFQLDRVGKEVRITDHDGSVYVGSLLASNSSAIFSASQAPLVAGSKVAQPSDRGMAPTPSARGYAFRASGNNLTWKQQVVITGALSQTNNLAVFRGNVVVGGRSNKRIEAVEQEP